MTPAEVKRLANLETVLRLLYHLQEMEAEGPRIEGHWGQSDGLVSGIVTTMWHMPGCPIEIVNDFDRGRVGTVADVLPWIPVLERELTRMGHKMVYFGRGRGWTLVPL